MTTLFIPSPSAGVWYLGPLPLRGYALCIIAGIIAAIWIGERRWVDRGGLRGEVTDLALWAVPFGVIGGRVYHVITDHDLYFGAGNSPIQALYVWRGGLGIWGAIAFGAVGVWIGAKTKGIRVPPVLDAMAPGVLVAQAIGRWGNWFNQELFGRPSTWPWALKIDPENRPPGYEQYATFQPTFLYECLWDLGAFAFVIWADRRFKLGHGRVLALYVMAYTAGRGWIEMLRIDDVEYQHVLGLRLNVWTSIVLFCLATAYFVVVGRKHPGRETEVYTPKRLAADRAAAGGTAEATSGTTDGDEKAATTGEAKGESPGGDGKAGPSEASESAPRGVATATMTAAAEAASASPDEATEPTAEAPGTKPPAPKAATAKAATSKTAAATKAATSKAAATKKAATSKAAAKKTTTGTSPTTKKAATSKTAATKKTTPAKKSTPAKKTTAARKTTPAKRTTPTKKAAENPDTPAPTGDETSPDTPNTSPDTPD